MKIGSFDVGVKNLAYCVLNQSNDLKDPKFTIEYWDVINIIPETESTVICQKLNKSGKRKGEPCGKKAIYKSKDDDIFYCRVHSPKDIGNFNKIINKKVSSITNQSLNIGLVKELDKILSQFLDCDEIVIEQQPYNKNPRMKTLSFMLHSYFITRGIIDNPTSKIKKVSFVQINSTKKLALYTGPEIKCSLKGKYSQNKFYSKVYCEYLIKDDQKNLDFFQGFKKKDDLADAFLQGTWYLSKKK